MTQYMQCLKLEFNHITSIFQIGLIVHSRKEQMGKMGQRLQTMCNQRLLLPTETCLHHIVFVTLMLCAHTKPQLMDSFPDVEPLYKNADHIIIIISLLLLPYTLTQIQNVNFCYAALCCIKMTKLSLP